MASQPKRTEGELLGLLRARHGDKAGNGEAWAFVTGVRSAAGFDARRTIDAVAMSLWPSRGLLLDGFEVKCNRGDWLRELKNPEKAEEFARLLDRMWIVTAHEGIVADGELPPGWGLLVAKGNRLVQKAEATLAPLTERARPLPEAFNRSFLAALLRAACRVGAATPEEVRVAREDAEASARRFHEAESARREARISVLEGREREFSRATGISIGALSYSGRSPADVGAAVKAALDGDTRADALEKRLRGAVDNAQSIADHGRGLLDQFGFSEGKN